MIRQIEIQVPIWKTKSVGINLTESNPEDTIHVTIAYKNADGRQIYPHTYELTATEINKYPVNYKGNGRVPLHDVPIKDFRILNVLNKPSFQTINQSNQLNQKPMLFGASEIKKLAEENKERSGIDNRSKIPMGENVLTIMDITATEDKNKNTRIVIEVMKDEHHKNIKEGFKVSGDNASIDKSRLLDFFQRSFQYLIQPCNDEVELVRQLKKFVGMKFKAAVRHEKAIYTSKEGENTIVRYPRVWYVSNVNDTSFKVDVSKCVKELSKKDMERVLALREMGHTVKDPENPEQSNANNSPANSGNIVGNQSSSILDDDLPF
jgi:hypothetical protein